MYSASLLPGETAVERFRASEGEDVIQWGELHITSVRLLFVPRGAESLATYELSVFLASISRLEKVVSEDDVMIRVGTKDARSISLWFEANDARPIAAATKDAERAFALIAQGAIQKPPYSSFFAFTSRYTYPKVTFPELITELQRVSNQRWKPWNNDTFKVLPTYAASLALAADILLPLIPEFVPARNNCPAVPCFASPIATLCRAAQLRSTSATPASAADATLLHESRSPAVDLLVLDARPAPPTTSPTPMGEAAGYSSVYFNLRHEYLSLPSNAGVRDAYVRLTQLCTTIAGGTQRDDTFLIRLEQTGWLQQLVLLLSAAVKATLALNRGVSVLVHCPDGADATSQVVSMTLLMLEPRYRTLNGFCELIEREWVLMGHKWDLRCGHGLSQSDPLLAESSPLFLQFLDCVHQLLEQAPNAFEFSEALLLWLSEAVYSGQFVNFLFNNEKQRQPHRATGADAFVHVMANSAIFLNPFYAPVLSAMRFDAHMRSVTLWSAFWLQRDIERLTAHNAQLKEKVQAMDAAARHLRTHTLSDRGEPALTQLQAEYRALKDQCHSALLSLEKLKTERGATLEQNKELTALVTQLRKKSVAHRK